MDFRFKAMREAHDPDDLDTAISLANPKSWIALFVALLLIVAAGLWAFLGTLPRSIGGVGVLSRAGGVLRVETGFSGVLSAVFVRPGDHVDGGAPVASVFDTAGRDHVVTAAAGGTVMVADYEPGSAVKAADPIAILERDPDAGTGTAGGTSAGGDGLSAMVVVPADRASGIALGTEVELTVASAPSRSFGLLKGRVTDISRFPITPTGLSAVVYDASTVQSLTDGAAVSLVTVTLDADPGTPSGYAWTSPSGPPFPLAFQTAVTADFRLGSFRPIDYIFGGSS